jgi:hypothetical protein
MRKIKTIPSFFQSDTLAGHKKQVRWLVKHLGLKHDFFAKVLGTNSSSVNEWLARKRKLDQLQEKKLGTLWHMFLHMLSLMNFDYSRVKELLGAKSATCSNSAIRLPWAGQSIRYYLENGGPKAIDDVNRWITSFRFG